MIRLLLHLYPLTWRREYGEEFADLLSQRPMSVVTVCNVLCSATGERVRAVEPWKLTGPLLLLWTLFGIWLNSVAPLSPRNYSFYYGAEWLVLFLTAYWTTARSDANLGRSILAAIKAGLLGNFPDGLVILLWSLGMLHPWLVGLDGSRTGGGHGIAILSFRGMVQPGLEALGVWLLVTLLTAVILGFCGAICGRIAGSRRPLTSEARQSRPVK